MTSILRRHIGRASWSNRAGAALVAIVAAMVLTSCASSQGKTGATQVTPTARGAAVEVILKDYEILMPESVSAGEITFTVTNAGTHDHNFEVEVGSNNKRRIENGLKPGESKTLVVSLTPGTYSIECPVGLHSTQGMRRKLTVTGFQYASSKISVKEIDRW